MRRSLIVLLLFALLISSASAAQHRRRRVAAAPKTASGKVSITCPKNLKNITDCPDNGCGKLIDPNLNHQKNVGTSNKAPEDEDFSYLRDLDDPVKDFAVGETREKLTGMGEGKTIRVVAYALAARDGGAESCNCGLKGVADTDNHIVLVDEPTLKLTARATPAKPATATRKAVKARTAKYNTLKRREAQSETAEFTPRVRLDHEKLAGRRLQALIDAAPKNALLVRVTGQQMFDSEHSIGPFKLLRHNNWEIHPVFKLEYCPTGKTCTKGSDANWVDLER